MAGDGWCQAPSSRSWPGVSSRAAFSLQRSTALEQTQRVGEIPAWMKTVGLMRRPETAQPGAGGAASTGACASLRTLQPFAAPKRSEEKAGPDLVPGNPRRKGRGDGTPQFFRGLLRNKKRTNGSSYLSKLRNSSCCFSPNPETITSKKRITS